ncbi:hypothetical protein ACHAWX_001995 [Stephanocyclus meneghinianus]
MEDTVGLGNHIRHDALTGAAASTSNDEPSPSDLSFQSRPHATVFVSASATDVESAQSSKRQHYEQQNNIFRPSDGNDTASVLFAIGRHDNEIQDVTTSHSAQPQHAQHTMHLFPVPPTHPSAVTQTCAPSHLIQHQSLPHFPRPPPAPPSGMFPPPPPNLAPTYPPSQTQQPLPPFPPPGYLLPQLPLHVNCSPPPQLPPHFPSLPSVLPNIGPPLAVESINSLQTVSSHPGPHTLPTSQPSIQSFSRRECEHSLSLPHQHNGTSQAFIGATQQAVPHVDSSQHETQSQKNDGPIEKARAIARRFHIESTQRQTPGNNTLSFIPDSNVQFNTDNGVDYLKQRQAHFQKERTKLDKFRLKNLEYVIKHDEMELRRHVECMNQITAYEEKRNIQLQLAQQQQRQRQLKLEQREQERAQANMMNANGGGIGSRDQQRAERVRKREQLEQATSLINSSNGGSNSKEIQRTSLYLTNLPTDGSTTERILHSLFGSYGRLDRVTMYRHRNTGDLKGDGLIVFGKEAVEEYKRKGGDGDLIEAVCLQVRNITVSV